MTEPQFTKIQGQLRGTEAHLKKAIGLAEELSLISTVLTAQDKASLTRMMTRWTLILRKARS